VLAVRAADAGEALVQIAALEKGPHGALDDRAPEAVLGRKPLVVDLLEGLEMLVQQPPQVGGLGIARAVQRGSSSTHAAVMTGSSQFPIVCTHHHWIRCTLAVKQAWLEHGLTGSEPPSPHTTVPRETRRVRLALLATAAGLTVAAMISPTGRTRCI
jgi:hypothetical protein